MVITSGNKKIKEGNNRYLNRKPKIQCSFSKHLKRIIKYRSMEEVSIDKEKSTVSITSEKDILENVKKNYQN